MSIEIEGVEFQDLEEGVWFDIIEGGRFDVPDFRGKNTIVPSRSGQTRRNFVAGGLPIVLRGAIWGDGDTPEERRSSFASRMLARLAALGELGQDRTIVAYSPNEALEPDETATIEGQFQRTVPAFPLSEEWRRLDIQFLAIGHPPEWEIEEESS